jgi:hypothetical protein
LCQIHYNHTCVKSTTTILVSNPLQPHSSETDFFFPWYNWKIPSLALYNNHCLITFKTNTNKVWKVFHGKGMIHCCYPWAVSYHEILHSGEAANTNFITFGLIPTWHQIHYNHTCVTSTTTTLVSNPLQPYLRSGFDAKLGLNQRLWN